MLLALTLALQVAVNPPDSILRKLNFDPKEELVISKDSINLENLDYGGCLETRTIYPVDIQRFFGVGKGRTVKLQECFVAGTELKEKLVIITYYDKGLGIKTPIAFVAATRNDSTMKHEEVWGKADLGFITRGKTTRIWLTLMPEPKRSVRDQLIDLLLVGYKSAGKNK
ncbi:MAG: hypothetical protein AAB617_01890 [Patescibacteria group bacterium]